MSWGIWEHCLAGGRGPMCWGFQDSTIFASLTLNKRVVSQAASGYFCTSQVAGSLHACSFFQKFNATISSFWRFHLYLSVSILSFHRREHLWFKSLSEKPPFFPVPVWSQPLKLMRSSERVSGTTVVTQQIKEISPTWALFIMNCFFSLSFRDNWMENSVWLDIMWFDSRD